MEVYNDLLRQRFASLQWSGLQAGPDRLQGSAQVTDNTVTFEASFAEGRIEALRFVASACPHTLAAADFLCEYFTGKAVDELNRPALSKMLSGFAIPAEKTGRILMLEDALQNLYSAFNKA